MSFRTRLFGTYILVIVICLVIVAITTTVLLQGYRDRVVMDRLDNIARPVSVQVRSLTNSQTTTENLWDNLEQQAKNNNVYIILTDQNGKIVREITPESQTNIKIITREIPQNIANAVQGRFRTVDGRVFIYAAYPLNGVIVASQMQVDTIILTTPRSGTLAIIVGLVRPLLIIGIISLLLSLIVAVIFARSIYRPLNRVKEAAHKISLGDYDHKIPSEGPREIRELADSFNHMTGEVKRSQQQLRHFVADVSHELKSPLTSIQGFSQALLDGTASDEQTKNKAVIIINSESKRMRRQVDELLELSRMQSGQFKMVKEIVDVNEILSRCLDIFSLQASEKDITLAFKRTGSLLVSGDTDRLEQLFSNLIDNAVKNTYPGGAVNISSNKIEGFTEVRITDNGPGIPQDQLPHVFERFYQVTGVRTGVGLGLAIAKEITLAHGGKIEARSEPGEGAEFIVTLPAADK
jgi:two-component system, OmpR family, sensor kinase